MSNSRAGMQHCSSRRWRALRCFATWRPPGGALWLPLSGLKCYGRTARASSKWCAPFPGFLYALLGRTLSGASLMGGSPRRTHRTPSALPRHPTVAESGTRMSTPVPAMLTQACLCVPLRLSWAAETCLCGGAAASCLLAAGNSVGTGWVCTSSVEHQLPASWLVVAVQPVSFCDVCQPPGCRTAVKRLRREHAQLRTALGEQGVWGAVADAGEQAELEAPAEEDDAGRQAELEAPAEGDDAGRHSGSAARSQEGLAGAESDAKQTNLSALAPRCAACM